jgi:glycosyltransferase involved in cell wall biosynthesis
MGGLKIPFVFGPVGGGEIMPAQLRESLPWRAKFVETFRDLGNRFVAIDPLMRSTYSAATLIACATDETLLAIPERFHSKCTVQRAIGIDLQEIGVPFDQLDGKLRSATQLLFVGRLLYWKGLQFALRAMEIVRDSVPGAKLRIVGEGNDADWLKHIAQNAQLSDCVEWISRIAFDQMWKEYLKSAALVFPSLHDSGGMVVLEAMAAGMPVICLDLGGPGSMVDSSCGVALASSNRSELDIVKELSNVMIRMISEQEWQRSLAGGARERARTMSWDAAASAIYSNRSVLNRLGNQ